MCIGSCLLHMLTFLRRYALCLIFLGIICGISPVRADGFLHTDVIYEVFVRDFGVTGTLKDVSDRMDYIRDLGVDTIWLMPVYPNGQEGRKGACGSPYAVRDFRAVHKELGSRDGLVALVKQAHDMGLRVILDFVPNHCALDSVYVEEHPEWFARDKDGRLLPVSSDWNDVVKFDHENPAVVAELESIMTELVETYQVDGFRMDAAHMISSDIWKQWIAALRELQPDLFLLAEAEGGVYHNVGFDATYDRKFDVTMQEATWRQTRALDPVIDLDMRQIWLPKDARLLRFLENHDSDRAAVTLPPKLHKVAAAMLLTLPGIPMIYAGQEAGLTETPDLFEKQPLTWAEGNADLLDWYKKMIHLRKKYSALQNGSLVVVKNSQPKDIASYIRKSDEEKLLILTNMSDHPVESTLISEELDGGRLESITDGVTGASVSFSVLDEGVAIIVPAYGVIVGIVEE